MTLEQLRIFVRVVQAASFTRAADVLGIRKSYVSRVVAQLEAEFGVKLLERTTRSLNVTEMGRQVFERAIGIESAVDDTLRLVQEAQGAPRGTLRLTCGVEFGQLAVTRWVEDFLDLYPEASAEIEYTSRVVDLVHEGFDLSIRIGPLQESRLVARTLGQIDYGLFACPCYLARAGTPLTVGELSRHSLIMFSGGSDAKTWHILSPGTGEKAPVRFEPNARLRVNNSFAVRDVLLRSLGIGRLPLLVAAQDVEAGRLVAVLPDHRFPTIPVHAVFPGNRYLAPKVRAFVDLAAEAFPKLAASARAAVPDRAQSGVPGQLPG